MSEPTLLADLLPNVMAEIRERMKAANQPTTGPHQFEPESAQNHSGIVEHLAGHTQQAAVPAGMSP